ncbi:MAG: TIGR02266 family protein, partial [Myxococcaceae bacterium]
MDDGARRPERKSVGLLVKLNHSDLGNFVEGFATNISAGGMFIRSRKPHPVGTDVRFQIEIANGLRVMKGTAVVRWIREPGDPTGSTGMGLQFKDVDADTQTLIDKMVGSTGAGTAVQPEIPRPKAPAAKTAKPAATPPPAVAKAAPPPAAKPVAAAPAKGTPAAKPPAAAKTPAVAPHAAKTAPAAPPAAKPTAPAPAQLDDLDFGFEEDEPLIPAALEADEPMGEDVPPPPAEDVNISIDDLVRGTAASPAPADGAVEPVPNIEIELQPAETSEEVLGVAIEFEPPPEKPLLPDTSLFEGSTVENSPAPPSLHPTGDRGQTEIDLDIGGEELELELARPVGNGVPPSAKKPAPKAPAPVLKGATPARGSPAAAAPVSLPNIRREVPAAPPPAPAMPTLLDAPKPSAQPTLAQGPTYLRPPAQLETTGPVIGIDLGTT